MHCTRISKTTRSHAKTHVIKYLGFNASSLPVPFYNWSRTYWHCRFSTNISATGLTGAGTNWRRRFGAVRFGTKVTWPWPRVPFRKFLRGHVWTVTGNMHVKSEVCRFNHFKLVWLTGQPHTNLSLTVLQRNINFIYKFAYETTCQHDMTSYSLELGLTKITYKDKLLSTSTRESENSEQMELSAAIWSLVKSPSFSPWNAALELAWTSSLRDRDKLSAFRLSSRAIFSVCNSL